MRRVCILLLVLRLGTGYSYYTTSWLIFLPLYPPLNMQREKKQTFSYVILIILYAFFFAEAINTLLGGNYNHSKAINTSTVMN